MISDLIEDSKMAIEQAKIAVEASLNTTAETFIFNQQILMEPLQLLMLGNQLQQMLYSNWNNGLILQLMDLMVVIQV
jgi:hypothetical protein